MWQIVDNMLMLSMGNIRIWEQRAFQDGTPPKAWKISLWWGHHSGDLAPRRKKNRWQIRSYSAMAFICKWAHDEVKFDLRPHSALWADEQHTRNSKWLSLKNQPLGDLPSRKVLQLNNSSDKSLWKICAHSWQTGQIRL